MQDRVGWQDLRLVLAIGTSGTLAGAARDLGIDHSTAFRRLGALEAKLGVRLFDRARDGYAPTPAGEVMVATAGRMDAEIADLERLLAGQDLRPSGTVRVTTTDTLIGLLTPVFAAFRHFFPEIVLEVIVTNAFLTLTKRDADVAIRPAATAPETLVGRRMATIATAVYDVGSVETAVDLDDLGAHAWVGPDDSLAHLGFARWLRARVPPEQVTYRSNTLLGLLAAVRAGLGLAMLPCFLADLDPALRRVGPLMPEMETGLWLLTHPDLRKVARVRTFLDFMAEELGRCRPLLEGHTPATAPLAGSGRARE
ncbi:LysR family transcriptional regulator [Azospirillum canadense]|uniref:LysR family transcriptional regulator n=1 Tax=Azospirillum canadense TaxID=403962 RepID=UPI0022275E87|nr:LysR family transcriptional regulator [Azospirillum canadense]MCW2239712.1 DNA-binding transcriptional LysR family regulator [Azospirillum canadense]